MGKVFIIFMSLFLSSCWLSTHQDPSSLVTVPSSYSQDTVYFKEEKEPEVDLTVWWKQFQDPLLNSLVMKAFLRNVDFQTALEQISQSRATYDMASSRRLPRLNLFGTAARIRPTKDVIRLDPSDFFRLKPPLDKIPLIPQDDLSLNPQNFFLLSFDASWEIDLFGKNRNIQKAAYYNFFSYQEKANYIKVSTIAEVVKLYTQLRAAQQKLSITQKRIQVFEKLLFLVEKLKKAGLDTEISYEQQVASFNEAKSLAPQLQEEIDLLISNLAFLLGGTMDSLKPLLQVSGRIPTALGKVPVGLPSDLLQKRPDIVAAQMALSSSGALVGAAKACFFPSFSLTGIGGHASSLASDFFKKSARLGIFAPTIDWSLFEGGRLIAQLNMATSEQKLAALSYEKTVLNAFKEVEDGLTSYYEKVQVMGDVFIEYKAQKKVVVLSKTLVDAGLSDLSSLLTQYAGLFSMQEHYIDTKEQALLGLIALYKALGGGWDFSGEDLVEELPKKEEAIGE